ncbi:MAG: Ig-like domain-containing protein [Paludibacter sp.]|nr:Ig-like domain-containing protein [Paludibacter sp.]
MKHFTSKFLLIALFAFLGLSAIAQTTIQVGAGSTYTKIQSAYDNGIPADITSAGAYVIELQADYNPAGETYPITLGAKTGASATNSITIKPATGVTKTLSCPNQTVNLPGCVINSGTSITVPDGTGLSNSIYISNVKYTTAILGVSGTTVTVGTQTTTSGTYDMVAGPAVGTTTLYLNGAQFVTIDGVDRTGTTQLIIDNPNRIASQSILFKNDASNNTIKNCTVKGASQISIAAVTGTIFDNGTIYIYNTTSTAPEKGNDNNTIDHCDIVNGSSIPLTHVCISGSATATNDNNKITNCNLDNACLTVNTSTLTPGYVVVSSNTTNTEISNNRMYASGTISPAGTYSYGIITSSGINTSITSNIVGYGAKDGSGKFTIPATATGPLMAGIYIKAGSATVTNNTVAGFNIFCMNFSGIWLATTASGSVTGNVINDIKSSTTYHTVALAGIYSQTSGTVSYSNNTISNFSNVNTLASDFAMTKGLYVATASSSTASGNTIFNLTAGDPSATALSNLAIGIDATKNIATIEKNLIYNINAFSTANTAVINGIKLNAGVDAGFTIKNNVIRLGTDVLSNANIYGIYQIAATAATNKFYIYHNSVYIGGTAPSTTPVATYAYNRTTSGIVGVIDLRNNILSNQRVQGAAENHYAVGLLAATDLGTSNYNIYQYNGQFGIIGATNKADLTAWQGALYAGNDANSYSSNPQFVAPTAATPDLKIIPNVYSDVDAKGFDLSVVDDYFGSTRSGLSPTDIGAYAYTSDLVAPTVTISSTTPEITNVNPIPVTITFSEAVTGFDITDLNVSNGNAGNFVAVNATTYTADITPAAYGLITVDIAAGAASDAVTNGNVAATQFTRTYDLGSDVQNVKSQVFAYPSNNGIVIIAKPGQNATIYSATGQLVKKSTLSSDKTFIALPQGLYVVSVEAFKSKVLVK